MHLDVIGSETFMSHPNFMRNNVTYIDKKNTSEIVTCLRYCIIHSSNLVVVRRVRIQHFVEVLSDRHMFVYSSLIVRCSSVFGL